MLYSHKDSRRSTPSQNNSILHSPFSVMKRKTSDLISNGEQSNLFQKRRKTDKSPCELHQEVNLKNSYDIAIGRMNSQLLADYIARQTKKFRGDLSTLELHDLAISGRRCD